MTNDSLPNDPLTTTLRAAYERVNARHSHSRRELLDGLPTSHGKVSRVSRWPIVYGFGTFAATVGFMALWLFATPQRPANAIERIANALDQVTTYSYRHEFVSISRKDTGRTVRQVSIGRWRSAPVGLYATTRIEETLNANTPTPEKPKVIVDLVETHQAGGRGIIVDRMKQEFWWIDEELDADSIGNPLRAIYMVRQRRGRIVSDLGEKKIGPHNAKGFEIVLDQTAETELGKATSNEDWEWKNIKFEVWVDAVTDLPIEFRFSRRGDDFESTYRFTDLKWNPKFDTDAFVSVAPGQGYTELIK